MKNMYKLSFLLMCTMLSLGIFWACKRTISNDEIVGNKVVTAPSDFTGILEPTGLVTKIGSYNHLDSIGGYPKNYTGLAPKLGSLQFFYYQNTLSHKVTWYMKFVGQTSGAEKDFTGTSAVIDYDHLSWDGSPNEDATCFFLDGEPVVCTLTFLGSAITYGQTYTLRSGALGIKSYQDGFKILPNGDTMYYHLVDNMEKSGGLQTSYIDQNDGTGKTSFKIIDTKHVDGYFSFYMKGTDNNGNNYNGGSGGDLNELENHVSTDDPSKLYFNAYIYGYGRDNNSVFFQAFENDYATLKPDNTYDFNLVPREKPKNDMWFSIVEVDWVGWKLVSVPYSSFIPARDPANGANGNHIKEPRKIAGMALEFDSYPSTGKTVELAVDLVTISHNAPFHP